MNTLPKAIVITPIIIIVLAVFLRLSSVYESSTSPYQEQRPANSSYFQNNRQQMAPPDSISESNTPTKQLDLQGPWICSYNDENMQADIYIHQKNIRVATEGDQQKNNFLVKGDCLYSWQEGAQQGEKMCGIGQYLSMFEMFSSFLSTESLLGMLPDMGPVPNISQGTFDNLLDSCTKKAADATNFVIPTNIIFEEKSIEEATQ